MLILKAIAPPYVALLHLALAAGIFPSSCRSKLVPTLQARIELLRCYNALQEHCYKCCSALGLCHLSFRLESDPLELAVHFANNANWLCLLGVTGDVFKNLCYHFTVFLRLGTFAGSERAFVTGEFDRFLSNGGFFLFCFDMNNIHSILLFVNLFLNQFLNDLVNCSKLDYAFVSSHGTIGINLVSKLIHRKDLSWLNEGEGRDQRQRQKDT